MKHLSSVHRELPVGEVDLSDNEMKHLLGIDASREVSRTALLGMLAIDQARREARLDDSSRGRGAQNWKSTAEGKVKASPRGKATGRRACSGMALEGVEPPLRIVLVSGTTVGGMDLTERHFEAMRKRGEHLDCLLQHDCGSTTETMATHFGIFSEWTTLSTACSSAANAIMLGARLIADGQADIVVAGGSEALSVFHLNGFNSLMILDHEVCRPFDATRQGLNLGEGAAFVVMESEESAARRHVQPHAVLAGYGNACDAFHQTATSANGEGAFLAMTEALRMAGLKPADIQYVNAHGTGTPNNDQTETAALKRVFGTAMPLVSSTKSFTGHTTSASGAIEAVICILSLQHQFVPANLGWKVPMEDGIEPTLGKPHAELQYVLCNSFGFGGNDSSLVFGIIPTLNPSNPLQTSPPSGGVGGGVLSKVEITQAEQLGELKSFVKPLEARRMGKLMKSSLLSSLKALQIAGIERPDAIITATAWGCIENSERLLIQLADEGEAATSPTWFMQSTHNTIGSQIAIRTKSHGYNVTYTQGAQSLEWALRDARMLLKSGRCKTVLVGMHDETTPLFRKLMGDACTMQDDFRSVAMVLGIRSDNYEH